jgi:hypothetical protein
MYIERMSTVEQASILREQLNYFRFNGGHGAKQLSVRFRYRMRSGYVYGNDQYNTMQYNTIPYIAGFSLIFILTDQVTISADIFDQIYIQIHY